MDRMQLAQSIVHLDGCPISYSGRPYLRAIYNSKAERLVLRCSRQVEKTTTLSVMLLMHASLNPGSTALIVMPRREQVWLFRDTRLMPMLEQSPGFTTLLAGKGWSHTAQNWEFSNGSRLFMRSAYLSADSARGISADLLVLDEAQDLSPDAIPVLEQVLSHASRKRVIIAGTPKLGDNPLEAAYLNGSRCEWVARCQKCEAENIPGENSLGPSSPVCVECGAPISFDSGEWIFRNPQAAGYQSFWINHLMVPWVDYQEVLSYRETYGVAQFRNEVMGLPVELGEHVVNQSEVESRCGKLENGISPKEWNRLGIVDCTLTLGIDWGGGGKSRAAFALGAFTGKGNFRVLFLERRPPGEDPEATVARACEILSKAKGARVAADAGGNGAVINRMLVSRHDCPAKEFIGIHYSESGAKPQRVRPTEIRWSVGRTRAISDVFTHIKTGRITFPTLKSCRDCLPDIWGETAIYDDKSRTIRYQCPAGGTDDVLHALTYCLAHASYLFPNSPATST